MKRLLLLFMAIIGLSNIFATHISEHSSFNVQRSTFNVKKREFRGAWIQNRR